MFGLVRGKGRVSDRVRGGGRRRRRIESRSGVCEDGNGVGDIGERVEEDGYDRGSES